MIRSFAMRLRLALPIVLGATLGGIHAAPASVPASSLPTLPHAAEPGAPLYPDYYALALSHTALTDDPQWRGLHLSLAAGRAQPAVIVLPVQTQAYGFAGPFRALLGARLDQELRRRHVDASGQTDIVDWRGPFVRRTDDATIAAFAGEHRGATLLALYMGQDGDGHAFVTLGRIDNGKTRLARRRLEVPEHEAPALELLAGVLPALLSELGFGDAHPAPALPPERAGGCQSSDWALADLPATAGPVASACQALLMGSLIPDYLSLVAKRALPSAPDRQAWLARAWVEADALAARQPTMRLVAALAAQQLQFPRDGTPSGLPAMTNDGDPVVRPLARMLLAPEQGYASPDRSHADATQRYLQSALNGLPRFATAAVTELARLADSFHEVDLCSLERSVATLKPAAGCDGEAGGIPRAERPATRAQRQLLENWRLAAGWRELYVEGSQRGSASGIAAALRQMPQRIATHPATRLVRFSVAEHE